MFDEGVGTWGGWTWVLTDDDCPDVLVEVYPVAWEGDLIEWFVRSWVGGVPNILADTTETEGAWPVPSFGVGGWSPCPESSGILIPFG